MAVTRQGTNHANTSALMCSSFEETVEILAEAAMMGSKDDCRDITDNVLFRQMAPSIAFLFRTYEWKLEHS